MADSTYDPLEIDLFEALRRAEINIETYFDGSGTPLNDTDFFNDFTEETLISSEILCSTNNPVESSSDDIPTDPKEWLVADQTSRRLRAPRLYEFLFLLLQKPHYASYASFTDKSHGIFKVHEPEKIADLWEQVRNRQSNLKMSYDKFARAVRWYYKSDIMKKTNARYTFQFSLKTLKEFIVDKNNFFRF